MEENGVMEYFKCSVKLKEFPNCMSDKMNRVETTEERYSTRKIVIDIINELINLPMRKKS